MGTIVLTTIDLTCRYSSDHGFSIEGTSDALSRFAAAFRELGDVTEHELSGNGELDGYDETITRVSIRRDDDRLVSVLHAPSSLLVSGGDRLIGILAANIDGLVTDSESNHLHIDYHPDHYYLTEGSEPIVITRVDE